MHDWLLATTNPHKLEEIQAVLNEVPIRWTLLSELDAVVNEPVEDQDTFLGNASQKARHYARATGRAVVADDSGLSVEALGGRPGVRSARFAGFEGSRDERDRANNLRLLQELVDVPRRARDAAFVCVMVLWRPGDDRPAAVGRGELRGRIILPHEVADRDAPEAGRGEHGFGYDPLFVLPDDHPKHPRLTTAELTAEQKNTISHRGQAARALWQQVQALPTAAASAGGL
jgi:XTP/dITP diphosphohydrolase